MTVLARRCALQMLAVVAAAYLLRDARADGAVVEIRMRGDPQGARVWFDPVGVLLDPGQTVRWICEANYHTTTAYHPRNGNRSLRIPRQAQSWGSDVLAPGDRFEVRLTVTGTYDYCCVPHEAAGMVGRLIVGRPGGPGSEPFDWSKETAEGRHWQDVPPTARAAFPDAEAIMRQRIVPGTPLAMCSTTIAA